MQEQTKVSDADNLHLDRLAQVVASALLLDDLDEGSQMTEK